MIVARAHVCKVDGCPGHRSLCGERPGLTVDSATLARRLQDVALIGLPLVPMTLPRRTDRRLAGTPPRPQEVDRTPRLLPGGHPDRDHGWNPAPQPALPAACGDHLRHGAHAAARGPDPGAACRPRTTGH